VLAYLNTNRLTPTVHGQSDKTMLCNGLFALFLSFLAVNANYTADWTSLDKRPNPAWYDSDKFGIFVHWGVFSVPAHASEWLWWYWKGEKNKDVVAYMEQHYQNGTTYADFGHKFTAAEFNPDEFAGIIKASGARYFVLTSKHHEGYTLWPSSTSFSWNSVDVGAHRDLVGELAKSIRAKDIHFGLYFSQFEWFHPLYVNDKAYNTNLYPTQVSLPQMHEIVKQYEPDVIWSDGDWEKFSSYWQSEQFIAWLFNDSPVKDKILVNDRWGIGTIGHHGSFWTGSDKYVPGHLVERKWECCMTLDKRSWGYRRDLMSQDVLTIQEVLQYFVKTLAWGGNFLLNIGPDHLGRIPAIFEERLRDLGKFTNAYGEAIFETKPWIYQNDTESIWYTSKVRKEEDLNEQRVYNIQDENNTIVYAFILDWNAQAQVQLKSVKPTDNIKITLLGTGITLKVVSKSPFTVQLPAWQKFPYREVVVLKIEYAGSSKHKPVVHSTWKSPPRVDI